MIEVNGVIHLSHFQTRILWNVPGSLSFPPDAAEWTEKEVDLFVGGELYQLAFKEFFPPGIAAMVWKHWGLKKCN